MVNDGLKNNVLIRMFAHGSGLHADGPGVVLGAVGVGSLPAVGGDKRTCKPQYRHTPPKAYVAQYGCGAPVQTDLVAPENEDNEAAHGHCKEVGHG